MSRVLNVAVVGATETVGETILSVLEERQFPVDKLYPLTNDNSSDEIVLFKNRSHMVENCENFDFSTVDLAFFCAGDSVSAAMVPQALEAGCVVIDNSTIFSCVPEVPFIVPEVNAQKIVDLQYRRLITNPNCSTIQLAVVLKTIHDNLGIRRINLSTYQAVSGTGKIAIEELAMQTAALLNGQAIEPQAYAKQIAFNVFPHVGEFLDSGYSKEEMEIVWGIQKVFEEPTIQVNVTNVQIPVFFGNSAAVSIETERPILIEEVLEMLRMSPGIILMEGEDYPTPYEVAGQDDVLVGRVRADIFLKNGLNLWVVSDNVRKGAALNAIQIAETLINEYWDEYF